MIVTNSPLSSDWRGRMCREMNAAPPAAGVLGRSPLEDKHSVWGMAGQQDLRNKVHPARQPPVLQILLLKCNLADSPDDEGSRYLQNVSQLALHWATSQMTASFVFVAVRTWNLILTTNSTGNCSKRAFCQIFWRSHHVPKFDIEVACVIQDTTRKHNQNPQPPIKILSV